MRKKHTVQELQELQALPLDLKIRLTRQRIREWINYFGTDGVYVSFSGGKDSTVLMDICREYDPNIKAMFVDVPTQFPELREFVKTYDNVDIIRPKKNFVEVCEYYGFPLISKEVAECVEGARKYLTRLLKEEPRLTDRQTDRQTDRPRYEYFYNKLCGCGEYAKSIGGGYDNKYRKLRGIGEYSKRKDGQQVRRSEPKTSNHVGMADEEQGSTSKGEYP